MKKSMQIIILIIMALIIPVYTYSEATEDTNKPYIEIIDDMTNYETDKTIELTIKIKNLDEKISYFDGYIEYDKNVFEEVEYKDFTNNYDEETLSYFNYSSKASKIVMEFEKDIEVEEVFKLKLKVKDTIQEIKEAYFKLEYGSAYSYDVDKTTDFEDVIKIFSYEIEEPNPDIKPNPTPDPEPTPGERLYLSTEIYKIGNNDIENYKEGDKYISRIERETTKEEFITNLKTNGTIRILKHNGTELGENELVGTGMTLEVTKDEEKIELQIAVMGDLDGNGKITATDLSTLNQTILKIVTLENEYMIAGDLDENEKITATDLSTLNKMLLKIL